AYQGVLGWSVLMPSGSGFVWQTDPVAGLTLDGNYKYYLAAIDANGDGLRDFLGLPQPSAFPATASNGAQTPIVAYNTGHGVQEVPLIVVKDGVLSLQGGGTSPTFGAYT